MVTALLIISNNQILLFSTLVILEKKHQKNFIPIWAGFPSLKKIIPANPTIRGMHKEQKASSGGILFILIYY